MTGELLTLWSIRLALCCYAVVLFGNLTWDCCRAWTIAARWLWTLGCALLVVHIACAFHFVHDWQHARAVADTAKQTAELIGWEFGGGVYFNYAFALMWTADVTWSWINLDSYSARPKLVGATVHVYLLFIAINGAIIFEGGPTRWIGVFALVVISIRATRRLVAGTPEDRDLTSSL